jgi:hypothetical protein
MEDSPRGILSPPDTGDSRNDTSDQSTSEKTRVGREERRRHRRLCLYGYALRTLPNFDNMPSYFTCFHCTFFTPTSPSLITDLPRMVDIQVPWRCRDTPHTTHGNNKRDQLRHCSILVAGHRYLKKVLVSFKICIY